MKELRNYVLGGAFVVFADRIIDVQDLTIPALLLVGIYASAEWIKFFHRRGQA